MFYNHFSMWKTHTYTINGSKAMPCIDLCDGAWWDMGCGATRKLNVRIFPALSSTSSCPLSSFWRICSSYIAKIGIELFITASTGPFWKGIPYNYVST